MIFEITEKNGHDCLVLQNLESRFEHLLNSVEFGSLATLVIKHMLKKNKPQDVIAYVDALVDENINEVLKAQVSDYHENSLETRHAHYEALKREA